MHVQKQMLPGQDNSYEEKAAKWTVYGVQAPVNINKDRTNLGDLFITCYWYKRTMARGPEKKFVFNVTDCHELHITMLVCPATLTFDGTKLYTLDRLHDEVIKQNLHGEVEWDASI